ncbi:S41 family peptidase [Flagellimonas crocea]|uniref:S41 family peptidase n=1 Tax=Flagellimonas crocea TaxID=3067311 RepID=UPI00296F7BEF|nr:S41 family peptidase [Muricauda sp. DH64]
MKAIFLPTASLYKIFLTLNVLCWTNIFAQNHFSKEEILEDLVFLKESLAEAHYNLYAYTPKSQFDKNYNLIKQGIQKDSFSLLEATSIFQKVISKANNGHTEINFPGTSYGQYANSGGTLFPLEIAFENGKSLIRKNWSSNTDIKIGAEILSINGTAMSEILSKINPLLSAERPYFKNAKIELYSFPRLYWQAYGKQDRFEVTIRSNGVTKTYLVDAIALIEGYEMKRNELIDSDRKLEFIGKSAYLKPGNFSGNEEEYRQFIDSAFGQIIERKSKNLIVDLRNNGGGDDSYSDYLVSYVANRPFKWHSSFKLKTSKFLKEHVRKKYDTTSTFWQSILNHKNGEAFDYDFEPREPQPPSKRFVGNLYVLVNRQSHSQAAVTAAQIQDYHFGTIVGEETGEYPTLYASQFQYALPNTKITVNVSKGYTIRVNGSTKKEGVVPDIRIQDHLLDEKDEILNGLLQTIN